VARTSDSLAAATAADDVGRLLISASTWLSASKLITVAASQLLVYWSCLQTFRCKSAAMVVEGASNYARRRYRSPLVSHGGADRQNSSPCAATSTLSISQSIGLVFKRKPEPSRSGLRPARPPPPPLQVASLRSFTARCAAGIIMSLAVTALSVATAVSCGGKECIIFKVKSWARLRCEPDERAHLVDADMSQMCSRRDARGDGREAMPLAWERSCLRPACPDRWHMSWRSTTAHATLLSLAGGLQHSPVADEEACHPRSARR
jgi:hypothetical protein